MNSIKKTKLAGLLLLIGMVAGIFSVSPSIDSTEYLTKGALNPNEVVIAAIFQFAMSLSYIGIAILLYPIIKGFSNTLSTGFLSFRIIAVTLSIIGTILLLSTLILSQEFSTHLPQDSISFEVLGNVLKISRDYINHVFMILVLCTGNILLYVLLIRSKLIPRWLSVWGIIGALLSVIASLLVLFQAVDIITPEYLILNAPTAFQELVLGIWLILRGFDKKVLDTEF